MIISSVLLYSQNDSANYKTVIPGKDYEAGWLFKVFFGSHWRSLWTVPVKAPVLDLDTFEGGITPFERGGGMQTKSLKFRSKNGVVYKFRSINKDPEKALPVELRETFASDILQDQISSSNPMAPLIVSPLLNTLGILQAEPVLCILPDSKKLGPYQEEFGGLFGTIEYHPDEYDIESLNFMGAEKVVGTEKLIEKLRADNSEFVNSAEYLKARLADILIGDWDRHIDQWRWARFSIDDRKYWYPIPRDRDQAFAKYDGLFPFIVKMSVTQLEHFSDTYYDVEAITWSGRYTDRRFLHFLTKAEWDSVAAFVQKRITDSVITLAVKRLPEEMFIREGQKLIDELKSRRDKLNEISDDFYAQIIKYTDIHLSDEDELVEVLRLNDNEAEIKAFRLNKNREPEPVPFYKRIFSADETKEIRIILNGGNDKAVVTGTVDESIKIFISGDQDKDTLIDNSLVNGYLFSFLPVPDAENKTVLIDRGDKTFFSAGSSTDIRNESFENDPDKIEIPRDWGHDWRFAPWFSINPDDGLFIGGGGILYEFGFRRPSYVYRMELTGGYALHADRFRIRYKGEFNPLSPGIKYLLEAKSSGLEVLNFYGYGNETGFNAGLFHNEYYKVKQQQLYIKPSVEFMLGRESSLTIGTQLKYTDTDHGDFLFQLDPYGARNMLLLTLITDFTYDSRTSKDFPVSGVYFRTTGSIHPPVKKDQSLFAKLKTEVSFYLSQPQIRLSSVAFKTSAEKIWGRFPFFESAFIGGDYSLRGFDRNRFAGDASLYSSLELRFFLLQTKLLVPFYLGITALGDAGKVFYQYEKSKKIHNSYGGGIWMSFVKPEYLFTLYYAKSTEDSGMYFNFGFPF